MLRSLSRPHPSVREAAPPRVSPTYGKLPMRDTCVVLLMCVFPCYDHLYSMACFLRCSSHLRAVAAHAAQPPGQGHRLPSFLR